jgi:hypothetical protein
MIGAKGIDMAHSACLQLRSIFADIGRWWRGWLGNRQALAELQSCSRDELRQIASDFGTTADELRALAAKWPDSANLLGRRMAALEIDPDEIARRYPAVANDLKRLCSLCQSKGECEHDLDRDPGDPRWREYCPNASTLTALRKEPLAQSRQREKS